MIHVRILTGWANDVLTKQLEQLVNEGWTVAHMASNGRPGSLAFMLTKSTD